MKKNYKIKKTERKINIKNKELKEIKKILKFLAEKEGYKINFDSKKKLIEKI